MWKEAVTMIKHILPASRPLCLGITAAILSINAVSASFAAPPKYIETSDPETAAEQSAAPAAGITETGLETWEEPTEPVPMITDTGCGMEDACMLARMAMAEAEGEDTEGKALIILTILNRVRSPKFPGTIAEVIAEKNAFSSYSDGRYNRVEPDEDCWAALALIQGTGWDKSQGALYFERTPEPGESTWHSRNLERLFMHGNHTFYKEREKPDEN